MSAEGVIDLRGYPTWWFVVAGALLGVLCNAIAFALYWAFPL